MENNIKENVNNNSLPIVDLTPTPITPTILNTDAQENLTPQINQNAKTKPIMTVLALLLLFVLGLGGTYLYFNLNNSVTSENGVESNLTTTSILPPNENLQVGVEIFSNSEPSLNTTIPLTGNILPGQTLNLKHDIDENTEIIFYLTSNSQSIEFDLTTPNGTKINKDYAKTILVRLNLKKLLEVQMPPPTKLIPLKIPKSGNGW